MRRAALAVFGTVVGLVLLLSFKTHVPSRAPVVAVGTLDPGSSAATGSTGSAVPSASAPPSAPASPSASASASASASRTVTGDAVDTRWGPVQVTITVSAGRVTRATAIEYPENNPRDQQINATAIPTLERESIGVSKADIDAVSGATYTSQGYIGSLQSALDRAGL